MENHVGVLIWFQLQLFQLLLKEVEALCLVSHVLFDMYVSMHLFRGSYCRMDRGLYRSRKADANRTTVARTMLKCSSIAIVAFTRFLLRSQSHVERAYVEGFFSSRVDFGRWTTFAPLHLLLLLVLHSRQCPIGIHCSQVSRLIGVRVPNAFRSCVLPLWG